AFLGWVRMSLSEGSSRSSSVATTGSRPTNSGIRPYFNRSSGWTSRKISPALRSSGASTLALKPIEADRPRAEMIFSSPLKAPPPRRRYSRAPIKGPATHEQDVGGVDLQEFLLRMLASALRRHRRDGAFHDLEQGLLSRPRPRRHG